MSALRLYDGPYVYMVAPTSIWWPLRLYGGPCVYRVAPVSIWWPLRLYGGPCVYMVVVTFLIVFLGMFLLFEYIPPLLFENPRYTLPFDMTFLIILIRCWK